MRILILSTWFPYPTDQGSKHRAYHLIRGLAERHEVALVSFEDKPVQPQWLDHMRQSCRRIEIVHRKPFDFDAAQTRRGLFSMQPAAVVGGYSPAMSQCVQRTAQEFMPQVVFAITFVTAPYALELPDLTRIIDLDNLLAYMLYEEYRATPLSPRKLRRYLSYWKMLRYEHALIRQFDLSLVVSQHDLERVQGVAGTHKVALVANGVDVQANHAGEYAEEENTLIFNGALSYAPNYDAMRFFLNEVFPAIQRAVPETRIKITGATTGVDLEALPSGAQILYTGYVDDIAQAVGSSTVCVVPLRQGAGTRLKILEAMALGTPVVSTSKGAEGLEMTHEQELLIADTPAALADATVRLLQDPPLRQRLSATARRAVEQRFDWHVIRRAFCEMVEHVAAKA